MQTTKYKLFRSKRLKHLVWQTHTARQMWNYFLGWQYLRYSLGLPYMNFHAMSREFTILRNAHPDIFARWRDLDSWVARDILMRLHRGYERFFNGNLAKRPPLFKSWRKPYSFTMSPSGYKFSGGACDWPPADVNEPDIGFYGDKVRIMGKHYRFNLSRPIRGNIKTVTVKVDTLGDVYLSVVTDYVAGVIARYADNVKTITGNWRGISRCALTCFVLKPSPLKV